MLPIYRCDNWLRSPMLDYAPPGVDALMSILSQWGDSEMTTSPWVSWHSRLSPS